MSFGSITNTIAEHSGKTKKESPVMKIPFLGSAYENRTRVPCVRGMCPSR